MKKIISTAGAIGAWFYLTYSLRAQDTMPRGPSEWTPRNWLGFFIYIAVFILVVIGIYKLATGVETTEEGRGEEEKRGVADQ